MLTKKQLVILIMIGFVFAAILKIFKMGGWIESIPNYIILLPMIIFGSYLLFYTDTILEKMGYHPSFPEPNDVPLYLENIVFIMVFISLIIAILLGIYLFYRILRKMLQTRIKMEQNILNC